MEAIFAEDYSGGPFRLFGLAHIVALLVLVLVNAGLIWRGRRLPQRYRRLSRYALAALLLVNEVVWHAWIWLMAGRWNVQEMLPLHLCSIMILLSALVLISKNYRVYELVYFLGISGALQALLTPNMGRYGFPHYLFFQFFISHGCLIIAAVYMSAVEGYRPYPMSLIRVAAICLVYTLCVGLVNALIGSNYLYIAHKPETASALDLFPVWPWYILFMASGIAVSMALLYLPFAWRDWAKRP